MRLRQSQRWLQAAILDPNEPSAAALHITPSPTLTPAERVGIYRDLYPARLVSALKADFPFLCQCLGGPVFTQLALLYAAEHPSRAFTLNAFGAMLPQFLLAVKGLERPSFAVDLAHFEQACAEVFHEVQAVPLDAAAIAKIPPAGWASARLQPVLALRLLHLRFPIHRYAEGQTRILRRETHLVVYRRNYQVAWLPLTPQAARVLSSLVNGEPLPKALNGARGPVMDWFQQWMSAGLFQSIDLAG